MCCFCYCSLLFKKQIKVNSDRHPPCVILSVLLMLSDAKKKKKIKALKALEARASLGAIKSENLSRDSNVEFANLHCNNYDKKRHK